MQYFDDAAPDEYTCHYCNERFNAQFVICKNCNKERRDIAKDRLITNVSLVAGISFILVAIFIEWQYISFIYDPETLTGLNTLFTISILLIVLGIACCIICCVYYFRVRNKIDFYYLE